MKSTRNARTVFCNAGFLATAFRVATRLPICEVVWSGPEGDDPHSLDDRSMARM
ncbi:MAG: hypothetical protein WBC51_07635 [Vicinamibacterales bacterium]